ncbi:pilus assembly protein [Altererythrobacter aerius]|uniref:Pilus assembly protein n=1 Tax=Tsuneonella aeria TaxID=1837929 RepID=A0A6I4TD53_9SPHN|nr:pilus assembly protein [Tsuneonella aeria]
MIETALVAPVLAMMAVGAFEMGTMVQKQQELQSAASEAEAIVLAAAAGDGVSSTKLKELLATSTGIAPADIVLEAKWRCGNASTFVDSSTACSSGQQVYAFVQTTFKGRYTPTWTSFGLGTPFNYNVVRTVQVG